MQSKTVLVTGATSGIGKAAALELALQGAKVVFNSRDKARGEAVRQELIDKSQNDSIHVLPCDFMSLEQVKHFAEEYKAKFDRLDVLINNAGAFFPKLIPSTDGWEATFAVNHLAPFYLTQLLLPLIKESAPARIINVSSTAHKGQDIPFNYWRTPVKEGEDRPYSGLRAYGQSKLANILFTRSLAQRLKDKQVAVNALHPGVIRTRITRRANWLLQAGFLSMGKSVQKGAETIIFLATSPDATELSGEYLVKKRVAPSSSTSQNMELAEELWNFSEELIQSTT